MSVNRFSIETFNRTEEEINIPGVKGKVILYETNEENIQKLVMNKPKESTPMSFLLYINNNCYTNDNKDNKKDITCKYVLAIDNIPTGRIITAIAADNTYYIIQYIIKEGLETFLNYLSSNNL